MDELLVPVLVGLIAIMLGIINLSGNISLLHSYHRKRVAEEDRIPFGRMVGIGTILVGLSVIIKASLQFASAKVDNAVLDTIGTVCLAAGLVIGLAIIIYAMLKYNKGIF